MVYWGCTAWYCVYCTCNAGDGAIWMSDRSMSGSSFNLQTGQLQAKRTQGHHLLLCLLVVEQCRVRLLDGSPMSLFLLLAKL